MMLRRLGARSAPLSGPLVGVEAIDLSPSPGGPDGLERNRVFLRAWSGLAQPAARFCAQYTHADDVYVERGP